MSHLVPCAGCQRHVRVSDENCPFCGRALTPEQRNSAPPPLPGRRLGRAALFTFGATMLSAAACSSGSGGNTDARNDAPAADGAGGNSGRGGQGGSGGASSDGGGGTDGGKDAAADRGGGGVIPLYGVAAFEDK